MKVDLFPQLRDILNSNYDPKGAYGPDPDKPGELKYVEGAEPTGSISLNAYHYAAFEQLCKTVKYKPEGNIQDLGGDAAMVTIKDLAAAIAKANQDTVVAVSVPDSE